MRLYVFSLVSWLAILNAVNAQGYVVPPSHAGTEGSSTIFYQADGTFQCVYSSSLLSSIPSGSAITGMRFRMDGGFPTNALTTYTNFDIYLGPSNFTPGSLSASASSNTGAGTVLARSGNISFPANSFPEFNAPNAFGPLIPFSTSFTYTGGNLLLTIAYEGVSNPLFWDAVNDLQPTEIQSRFGSPYNTDTLVNDFPSYGPVVEFTVVAVPEPSTIVIVGVACFGVAGVWKWRRRNQLLDQPIESETISPL